MSRNNEPLDTSDQKKRFHGIPKWLKSPTEVQVEDEMYKVNEVWKNINTRRIEEKAKFFSTVKESAELRWKSRLEKAIQKNQYDKVFKILEGYSKGALDVRKGIDTLEKSHEKSQKALENSKKTFSVRRMIFNLIRRLLGKMTTEERLEKLSSDINEKITSEKSQEVLENSEKTFSVRRMIFNLIRRLLGKMTTEERLEKLSSDIKEKITAMERVQNYFDGYTAYLGEVKPRFFLISSHNEDSSISEEKKESMNELFDKVFSKTTGEVNENELNKMLECDKDTEKIVDSMKKEWEEVLKKTKARKQASGKKKKHTDPEKQLKKEAKQFIKTLQGKDIQTRIQTERTKLKEDYALLQKRHEKVLVSERTVRAKAAWIAFKLEYIRITLKSEKDAVAFTKLLEEGIKLRKKQQEVEKQKEATCKELDDLLEVQPCITHRKKLLREAKTIVQRKKNTKSLGKRVFGPLTKVGTAFASQVRVGSCWEAPQCDTNPNGPTKDDAARTDGTSEKSLPMIRSGKLSIKPQHEELKRKGLFGRLIPRRRKNKARKKHF